MIIIDGIIFSLQKHGGISTYFTHLCRALNSAKLETGILLYNDSALKNEFNGGVIQEKRILERFRTVKIPSIYSKNCILHSSYYRSAADDNVKNIITIYDFIYEKFESNYIKKSVHLLQKRQAIKKASAIICISESTKVDFLEYYPEYNPEQVFVTHLAHSSESVQFSPDFIFEKKFERPYVLFVGMRSAHKNFNACVKALNNVDVDFKIVGGGPLSELEKKLLESNVAGRYQHLTYVNNDCLNRLYSDAVCLLYPSLYEGFGLPILEAQANGCAVVTTNSSSLPEVALDSAILLDIANSQSIEQAVSILLNDQINKSYVEKGFLNINRFDWSKTAMETIDIYTKIVNL
jgi:mannosyltransferase